MPHHCPPRRSIVVLLNSRCSCCYFVVCQMTPALRPGIELSSYGASLPVSRLLHYGWIPFRMLQTAGPVVLTVLFLYVFFNSGHSFAGRSVLVFFWIGGVFSYVCDKSLFLADYDEVPHPRPWKWLKRLNVPLCLMLGVFSLVSLCLFSEQMVENCEKKFCTSRGHLGVKLAGS